MQVLGDIRLFKLARIFAFSLDTGNLFLETKEKKSEGAVCPYLEKAGYILPKWAVEDCRCLVVTEPVLACDQKPDTTCG